MADDGSNLSEASLELAEDEDQPQDEGQEGHQPQDESSMAEGADDDGEEGEMVIDLPGEAITAEVEEEGEEGPSMAEFDEHADPVQEDEEERFHGYQDFEVKAAKERAKALKAGYKEEIKANQAVVNAGFTDLVSQESSATNSPAPAVPKKRSSPGEAAGLNLPRNSSITITGGPSSLNKRPRTDTTTSVGSSSSGRKDWKPNANLLKPFTVGWVREVVYKLNDLDGQRDLTSPPQVYYYAPLNIKQGIRRFSSLGEITPHLASSGSKLTWQNFSFRKEPMGAPGTSEIVRNELEHVDIETLLAATTSGRSSQTTSPQQQQKSAVAVAAATTIGSGVSITPSSKPPQQHQQPEVLGNDLEAEQEQLQIQPRRVVQQQQQQQPQPQQPAFPGGGGGNRRSRGGAMPQLNPLEDGGAAAASRLSQLLKKGNRRSAASNNASPTPPAAALLMGQQFPPAVSITPISKSAGSIHSPRGGPQQAKPSPRGGAASRGGGATTASGKKILRPGHNNQVNCSIHCSGPGTEGFPSLSCVSCESMFHPVCVGLAQNMNYSAYEFYCAACPAPAMPVAPVNSSRGRNSAQAAAAEQKENRSSAIEMDVGNMLPNFGDAITMTRRRSNVQPQQQQPVQQQPQQQQRPLTMTIGSGVTVTQQPARKPAVNGAQAVAQAAAEAAIAAQRAQQQAAAAAAAAAIAAKIPPGIDIKKGPAIAPLRPIESQSVVNIAGMKYMVVPQQKQPNNKSRGQQQIQRQQEPQQPQQQPSLPILLKPVEGENMPSFEVEETPDGKLVLVPLSEMNKSMFVKNKKEEQQKQQPEKTASNGVTAVKAKIDFCNSLSSGYACLQKVFRYLTTREKLQAAGVCRLWRDIVYSPRCWNSIALKGLRIVDFDGFAAFASTVRPTKIDFRKVTHSKGNEQTWSDLVARSKHLQFVEKMEFPKILGGTMLKVLAAFPNVRAASAGLIVGKEFDIGLLEKCEHLEELRMKTTSGNLKISSFTPLPSVAKSLKKLSLLSLDGLTHDAVEKISCLTNLEELELSNCHTFPTDLFTKIPASLKKLKCLRLEKPKIEASLGDLKDSEHLEKLELIDAQLCSGFGDGLCKLNNIKKLLLIPSYKEEASARNAELLDSLMSMSKLTHMALGLTLEWLETVAKSKAAEGQPPAKDSFPITVNGKEESYTLAKLYKTFTGALPDAKVKILKMPAASTWKQHLDNLLT